MSPGVVARALAYPFDPHPDPFLFVGGKAAWLDASDEGLFDNRIPILAVGSNASPQRLAEKFGPDARVPVTLAVVADHVVVHSAKITAYGSMPATLHPWSGARARVHATWLTDHELALMDATESLGVEYERVPMPALLLDAPIPRAPIQTYVSIAGALDWNGAPAVSAAARHAGDAPPALDQRGAQRLAMTYLGLDHALEDFIAENVADAALRQVRTAELSTRAGLPYVARAD